MPVHRFSSTLSWRRQTRKLARIFFSTLSLDSFFVSAVTRELPGHYPYIVIKQYIVDFVGRWEDPSRQFFDTTRKELTGRVQLFVEEQFSQYTHGHLKQEVRYASWFTYEFHSLTSTSRNIMLSHIQKCADTAEQQIGFLLTDEHEPFTLNVHYYTEYRSKFLAHYKRDRLMSSRATSRVMRNLDPDTSDMESTLDTAISSLASLGLRSVDATSLAALLPPDLMEPAIGIMADVRAYFQGRERFKFCACLRMSWLTLCDTSCLQALCG